MEDIAASLLNGVMIFLLGAVIPAILVWQVVIHWNDWTLGLDVDSLAASGSGLGAAVFSFLFMRTGVRTIRKGVTALRRRRRRSGAV
ncbi:hypothetical protein [uncultured Brevundimonas sp.]|uniref:hypothetical protein n=1 Tax=uncultured Brevundimonas sp. TaxID=213418 RepID=UPI0026218B28|nr:hypothetical protein [uncultured Brevundimonas sp.]